MENGFRIAVCDDDKADLALIGKMTDEILRREARDCHISCYENAQSLLVAINGGERYDILLLDVLMGPMDGMALVAVLRRMGNDAAIIFISCDREMALQGYEVSAARYLAKPLDAGKLKEALSFCIRARQDKREILLSAEKGTYRISSADIQCVEAYDRGTRFYLMDEVFETRQKLSDVEDILPHAFFIRCHRSYLVNLACVRRIRTFEFELQSGALIPISKHRYSVVNKQFVDYVAD